MVLTAAEIAPCLAAAAIAIEATETTRRTTSSTLKHLYAALQLGQFTTCMGPVPEKDCER